MTNIDRRKFIEVAGSALLVIALRSSGLVHAAANAPVIGSSFETVAQINIELIITEVLVELVDLNQVYMWAFASPSTGPRIPGPVLSALEGDDIHITITNQLDEPHSFTIPGVVDSGPILPGQTQTIDFAAPKAGSYLYFDNLNAPVNRVLGLHGPLVVSPRSGNTPYSDPTPQVQRLFNDLGTFPAFPGETWNPDRSLIWIFNSIDPKWNRVAQAGASIDPATFVRENLPAYFTLNGKSGFFSSTDPTTAPRGRIGQPALIRSMNAGLPTHSPHIHGNHIYVLSNGDTIQDNVFLVDTWNMPPLERKDVLLPFRRPPDIPDAAYPPREEKFPLVYPMHCHVEMSQTSNGGNYPQGLVTHWMIDGP